MAKKYLIANWKMNPTSAGDAKRLASSVSAGVKKIKPKNIEVVLCPPFPYISDAKPRNTKIVQLGAQNCYFEDKGAYTGEVSPKMLKGLGCKYVIVGHSERRKYFDESSDLINKKIKTVLKNKMTPILAVGEEDRGGDKNSAWYNVISGQLEGALKGISAAKVKQTIIAYEPIWAIGTGKAATPDDVLSAKILIQKTLTKLYSKSVAQKVSIIYGGSTNSKNIKQFINEAGMQGALVGGASLDANEFVRMIEETAI